MEESNINTNKKMWKQKFNELKNNVSKNTEIIAELYLCSDPSLEKIKYWATNIQRFVGHHSWIIIKNISKKPFNIGGLSIPASEEYSIATWTMKNHYGIIFNNEQLFYKEFSNKSVYISRKINRATVELISFLVSSPKYNKWNLIFNCSQFALNLWNCSLTKETQLNAGIITTPISLAKEILKNKGKHGIQIPRRKPIYYGGCNPVNMS